MNMSGAAFSTRRSARSAMPRGKVPVDVDIAEHEHHREGFAFERDAERAAHRAVRAVAADHGAERCGLRRAVGAIEPDLHVALALIQRRQGDTALDLDAEAAEMAGQQSLGLVLRQAEFAIGQVVELEQGVLRRVTVDDGAQAVDPQAGIDHLARDPHVIPHLERARRDADGAAIGQWLRQPIDDAAARAVPRQLRRHRQADRTGAHDQNVIRHALASSMYRRGRREPFVGTSDP